ncbi:heme ABC transporter ATP-binding protein [Methanococcoides seepicolus]|uniref:Cobalamin import ATP-binding protein BtuD n=1 Tax=Methanococcoides seepicolus TaxID=2828780 RepID=A0A9E4ZH36_9EURY|nr:heme ABC transporter ATP-binding protein [Methanococcoides seepicolus]MCM1987053.1 heme ABC transporter ATP-binding protein [Methanococcoides seepicolus]
MLEIKDLNVSYGSRKILEDINISTEKGEFLGILGPNGSGKTTLVKAITKVLKPESGDITFNGRSIKHMSGTEIARHIAVVSQVISINFEFAVKDIVMMGRTPYIKSNESPEDFDIVEDSMEKTKTDFLKDRLVTQLSGGELQRVIIARALAQQTDILLLDEPTSHLDITNQIDILNLVKDESRKGKLVVAVVHDLNLAAYYCDKIALIRDGKLISLGTPAEVLTPETIGKVYNLPVEVVTNEITNSLYVIPKLEPLAHP